MHRTTLLKAIRIVGSQVLLAKLIGVSPTRLNNWLTITNSIPYRYAIAIEQVTQDRVTREELAPGITFPNADPEKCTARLLQLERRVTQLEKKLEKAVN